MARPAVLALLIPHVRAPPLSYPVLIRDRWGRMFPFDPNTGRTWNAGPESDRPLRPAP